MTKDLFVVVTYKQEIFKEDEEIISKGISSASISGFEKTDEVGIKSYFAKKCNIPVECIKIHCIIGEDDY